jgi:SAM-dependent methyltransferase
MAEFWETAFNENQLMWGLAPTASAVIARDLFARRGAKTILIPGIGYGRNAKPFLDCGMSVTGIEVSETAIALARSQLGLQIPIHHGSVTDMPFDRRPQDGIFCYGLIYLLDAHGREKLIRDCYRQLTPGGQMIFTVISKKAPMYGQGARLGEDWYERLPKLPMYFYDANSVRREFGPYGLVEFSEIDEPVHGGATLPFINVVCRRADDTKVDADEAVRCLLEGRTEVIVVGLPDRAQVDAIAEALKPSKTTILGLGDCQIGDLGARAIGKALTGNTSLKELWLFNNQIGDAGAQALGDALRTNMSLVTLCLNGNFVGSVGATAIGTALQGPMPLEELGLGRNQIDDVGAKVIGDALATNQHVSALSLNNNRIGDAGAKAIGDALCNNMALKTLRLNHNQIGNPGAEAIRSGLAKNANLMTLNFDHNPASIALSSELGAGWRKNPADHKTP